MEVKKCFIFSFSLYDEDEEFDNGKIFVIPLVTDEITIDQEEIMLKECRDRNLEHNPYGIHDISFGEVFRYKGIEYESIFGFSTYEVEDIRIQELMDIWDDILLSKVGIQTEPMFHISLEEYENLEYNS
jgi:hypothetical protein